MGLWRQLMDSDKYEKKYRESQSKQLLSRSSSRSLGTLDFMEGQASAEIGIGNTYAGTSWNTGNGMLVTTSANAAPTSTYSLTSALSMK